MVNFKVKEHYTFQKRERITNKFNYSFSKLRLFHVQIARKASEESHFGGKHVS